MLQSLQQTLYSDCLNRTELASFTSEATLLGGFNQQPKFPSTIFLGGGDEQTRRCFRVEAKGTFGSTGTPTFIFTVRLGTTAANDITGSVIGVTKAITTNSGVTNGTLWSMGMDIIVSAPGEGTNHLTLVGAGQVTSSGFATPVNDIWPTTPPTTTATATSWDGLLSYYLSLSATCSASSASNAIRLKSLLVHQYN